MVTTFYPPYHFGGDATYVRALARALVARGHQVEVVHCEDAYRTVSHTKKLPDVIEDEGIKVHRLKSRYGFLSPLITQQTGHPGFKYRELKEILDQDFDVVNFHNISLVGGPAVLCLSKAAVTLYTLHEHWLLCPTHIFWKNKSKACDRPDCFSCSIRSGIPPQLWRYTNLIKRSLQNVDLLIAPSTFTADKHKQAGYANTIEVLPLFSTLNPEKEQPFISDKPVSFKLQPFVFVGRVTASKGIIPVLNVFKSLPAINFQVVGDGDLLDKLKTEYKNYKNIQFTGKIDQPALVSLYRNAKAVILPSIAPETFGLTIVEAFACGIPALVRSSGGSRDIVDNTGGGYVYTTDDALVSYIKKLNGDSELCESLGKKARKGFEEYYAEDIHVSSYLDLIDEIKNTKQHNNQKKF